jgi:hypothetical protein
MAAQAELAPTSSPFAPDYAQALNSLLPPQFAEFRKMKEEVRETLTETMWFHDTQELFHLVAPAILGSKFLCETLPVYAPMIRKLHALAVANGKMAADNKLRLTWKMIGHVPTQKIKTNVGKEAVAIQEDDAICWAAICAEVFQTSPSYVNKLTAEVPLLPPLPEETAEEQKECETATPTHTEKSKRAGTFKKSARTEGTVTRKATGKADTADAKSEEKAANKTDNDPNTTTVLIPAPELKKGDVGGLYKFLDGNGCSGLVPLDAVFGGLEEGEFQSKLSRFGNAIAYAFFPNKLNVRVERVGEETEADKKTQQLKCRLEESQAKIRELESTVCTVQSQMEMMVEAAHQSKNPQEWLEWLEERR